MNPSKPETPGHRTAVYEEHFTLEALRGALAEGFRSDWERWRVVLHLGPRRCRTCRDRLRALASRVSLPRELERPGLPFDGALAAFRRLVALQAARADERAARLHLLWPIHRFCVENPHHPRWGVCRLVLEESRRYAQLFPSQAVATTRSTLELVTGSPRAELGAAAHDLEALGRAYLGESLYAAGAMDEAAHCLRLAETLLADGTGDPEPRVTLYELRSAFFYRMRLCEPAWWTIARVEDLARDIELDARHGEFLIRLGQAQIWNRAWSEAATALRQGLSKLPSDGMPNLRLEGLQLLVLAELRRGRTAIARQSLTVAKPLYDRYANPLGRAHQSWLAGEIETARENYSAAETPLRAALSLLLQLGRTRDAAKVLADLATNCVRAERPQDFPRLEAQILTLLRRPETRVWAQELCRAVGRKARELGVTIDWSAELLAEIEDGNRDWVH